MTKEQTQNDLRNEMEPKHTRVYHYAMTVKPTYGPYMAQVESDSIVLINFVFELLKKHELLLISHSIERDSRNLPHTHALVTSERPLCYKFMKVKGWHIYMRKLNNRVDIDKWVEYIRKPEVLPKDDYLFINDRE